MEINRNSNSSYPASGDKPAVEAAQKAKTLEQTAAAKPVESPKEKPEPRLEQLQKAMRDLPEVDMEQVTAIKRAIARGELSADVKTLAASILAHHRGASV